MARQPQHEPPHEPRRAPWGAQQAASGHAHPTSRPVVLVAEDDVSMRMLLTRVLGAYGFEVLAAADGPEALALAAVHAGPIDLLVTDVEMPGLTGVELAQCLGAARPELAVLFVSGRVSVEARAAAARGVAAAFLAKPFGLDELRRTIVELTGPLPARRSEGSPRAG